MDPVIGLIPGCKTAPSESGTDADPQFTQADLDCWNTTVSPEPATPLIGHLEPDLLTPQPLLEYRRLGGDRGPRVAAATIVAGQLPVAMCARSDLGAHRRRRPFGVYFSLLDCGFRAIPYTRSDRIRTPIPTFSYTR